ncbi:sensor histidine kinase [Marinicrinis sediminis]|uniref:histidine kinase n=1 Tax=Marinicrinis sediminis TaxID=1652465 RepID=A0ABW5R8K2_9BACL
MKWKLTSRFLIAMIVTILISFVCLLLLVGYVFFYRAESPEELWSVEAPGYTLEFGQHIHWKDNEVVISPANLSELKRYGSWIQVLDKHGYEIYSRYKPVQAPRHYSAAQMIYYHAYSGALANYTLFAGQVKHETETFSYVLGFPMETVSKASFHFKPDSLIKDTGVFLFGSLFVLLTITCLIGYVFSTGLLRPIIQLLGGIQSLSKGIYPSPFPEKGLFRDVHTHLNQLSKSLQQAEKERFATDKMREEWISNISHDIKTPLSSIRGYSELLQDTDDWITPEQRAEYAGIMLDKSQYIESLIEDLKLIYQLKQMDFQERFVDEDLVELARQTVIDLLNHSTHEGYNISFSSETPSMMRSCHRLLLQRAISNLLYNAIIHNPAGTEVKVHITRNGTMLISDNGKGIPSEDMDKLFQRYYRGTNTSSLHKGSGLGMAIAKQIVDLHDGELDVQSEINKGTRICITL